MNQKVKLLTGKKKKRKIGRFHTDQIHIIRFHTDQIQTYKV
jgi:hypothetical protein